MLRRVPGIAAGAALAPLVAFGSAVRRARVFHPRGMVVWGSVTPIARPDEWSSLGARLRGSVLIRFSGAWWKERQWLDVLGCALRFTHAAAPSVEPLDDDQDLLLATVRVPATTLLAPLTTHVDDYLSNAYFGVSPFTAPGVPMFKLRLRVVTPIPTPIPTSARTREDNLELALARARVRLVLEARRALPLTPYQPIAEIELIEHVDLDQSALRFDPYRAGRELQPSGFVHAMRIPVYAASRGARHAVGA